MKCYWKSFRFLSLKWSVFITFQTEISDNIFLPIILRGPDAGRNDRRVVVFSHLVIDGVEFLIVPVIVMDHSRFGIIRNQNTSYAAEVLIHVNVGGNPCTLLLIDESFNVRVLAVRHDAHEEKSRDNLTGIRIGDLSRISSPIDLDLLTGLSVDMHRSTAFLLVLLDVIAELGIHERIIAGLTAFLQIFRPEKLLIHSISKQLLLDVAEVRHAFC